MKSNNHHNFSPELKAYFIAISAHMKARLALFQSSSFSSNLLRHYSDNVIQQNDWFLKINSKNKVTNEIIVENAESEVRLIREMLDQLSALEGALLVVNDEKKVKFNEDLEASFAQLWCGDVAVVMSALEFVKHILKDTHRYAQYLEREVDRLVLACSRVLTAIHPKYYDPCSTEGQNSELQNQFLEPIDSISQILSSLLKCPVLSTAISPESFSSLFKSIIPYYLNFKKMKPSKSESKANSKQIQFKIESITSNMISLNEPTNFLLTLLRQIQTKFSTEINLEIQFTVHQELKVLIELAEQFSAHLTDLQMSKLNLDSIFPVLESLIQSYPESRFELSRDYRLLVVLREIVFKIVNFKGDPAIWEHLTSIGKDLLCDGKNRSNLLEYVNIALENRELLEPIFCETGDESHYAQSKKPYFKSMQILPPLTLARSIKRNSHLRLSYDPTEFRVPNLDFEDSSDEEDDTELSMFAFWFNSLATTFDMLQAKLSLDYLNQNFDDLALKYPEKLEPVMDHLVRACTRQYRLFVIRYFAPSLHVRQPSIQSLQIFHATTSLLKRIFTSSSLSLKTLSTTNLYYLIMMIFSFRLAWAAGFASTVIPELESCLIASDLISDPTILISICIRMLSTGLKCLKEYSLPMYCQFQSFTRDLLCKLTAPLMSLNVKEEIEEMNLDSLLWDIIEFIEHQRLNRQEFKAKFEKFLFPKDDIDFLICCPLIITLQLTMLIIQHKRESIWKYLSTSDFSSAPLPIRMFNRLIAQAILIQSENPYLSRWEIMEKLSAEPKFEPIHSVDKSEPCVPLDLERIPNLLQLDDETLNEDRIGIITIELDLLPLEYEDYAKFPTMFKPFVNVVITSCAKLMNKMAEYSFGNLYTMTQWKTHKNQTNENATKLTDFAQALGRILLKMFSPQEDACAYEHIWKSTFKVLVKANMALITQYPYARENLYDEMQWFWELQAAITKYTKPSILLICALEFYILDFGTSDSHLKLLDPMVRIRLIQTCLEMIEVACEKLFFSIGAIYSTELTTTNQFDLEVFLLQVELLMNAYPLTCLEQQRDYKLLELMKRVMERLYQHHGAGIQLYFGKIDQPDLSPVVEYFRLLQNEFES